MLGFVSPPLEGAVARRLFRPSHRVLGFWPTQYHVCPRCGIGVDLCLKPGSKDIDSAKFRFGSIALNVCMCYMSRDVEMAFSKLGARQARELCANAKKHWAFGQTAFSGARQ